MKLLPQNPFFPTKIEHDQDPVFWLSGQARKLSRTMKPAFVSGSRGSGKTTLLRSLRTAEIKTNASLRTQYGRATFDWFGVYLQFNRTLQSINSTAANAIVRYLDQPAYRGLLAPESVPLRTFQSYLETTIILAFLEDLISVSDRKEVFLHTKTERFVCDEISARIADQSVIGDIYALRSFLTRARGLFSALPTEQSIPQLIAHINRFAPGELLGWMVDLVKGLRGSLLNKNVGTKLLVLIDDCESLTEDQQTLLNTVVKQFEGGIKFVVSFIAGQYNRNTTLLPNTVLSNADFEAISLDDESREDFIAFCERVTQLRLEHYYNNAAPSHRRPLQKFSLDATLGSLSPNELVRLVARASISPEVKSWTGEVEKTKDILREVIARRNWRKFSIEDQQTPYIEHAIIALMKTDPYSLTLEARQDTFAKVVDRKNFAALIYCVENIIGSRTIPYAGKDVVCGLATGCIRDYLDIMGAIYDEAIGDIDEEWSESRSPKIKHLTYFVAPGRPIPMDRQRAAIYRASEDKWEILRKFTVKSSFEIIQVVSGLGNLLALLQKPDDPYKMISKGERGRFSIDPVRLDTILSIRRSELTTREALRTLQRDGFVRLVSSPEQMEGGRAKSGVFEFHLHRRLYPVLGLSPRGPYESVRLDETRFAALLLDPNMDTEAWARRTLPASENTAVQGEIGL
jgi:hypothetical protein